MPRSILRILSPLIAFAAAVALAWGTFRLATAHNDFPLGFHPDEWSKVSQVLRPLDLNFNHPLLLIEGTIRLRQLTGSTTLDDLAVVREGRTFSAAMAGLWTLCVVLAGYRVGRWPGLLAFAATAGVVPPLLVYGHYMKEDASLAGGLGAVVLALTLACTARRRWTRLLAFALLGAAVALAVSGKLVGAATLPLALLACLIAPAPAVASRLHRRLTEPLLRTVVLALTFSAALLTLNHRAFDFTPWPVPHRAATAGLEGEIDHALTEHTGVRLAQPNTYAPRIALAETHPVVLSVLTAGAIAVPLALRRRLAGARAGGDTTPDSRPVSGRNPDPARPARAEVFVGPGTAPERPADGVSARDRIADARIPLSLITLLILLPITYCALLAFNVIPFARYALPVTLGLHLLAGLAMLGLYRLVRVRTPRTAAALLMIAVGVVAAFQAGYARDLTGQFEDDSRLRLARVLATLPPGARVVADHYAVFRGWGVPGEGAWWSRRRDQRLRLEALTFAADAGDLDALRRRGVQYVAISGLAFERFLDRDVRPAHGDDATFNHRRNFYTTLLAETPVWSAIPARPTRAFTNPDLRLYRLTPPGTPRPTTVPTTNPFPTTSPAR